MKNYIDTNIIIRFLVGDKNKALFNKSVEIIEQIENGEINAIILESVIMECLFVLEKLYALPRKKVVEDLKKILLFQGIINHDKIHLIEALSFCYSHKIDFVDSLIITKAKYKGYKILSFDKKLMKHAE